MNKNLISLLAASAIFMSGCSNVTADTHFTDIAASSPYAEAVKFCYDNNLMSGTSDTEFSPNDATSRAMLVTILHRREGAPTAKSQSAFTDVESGSWYAEAVNWANETSLVSGYDNEHFAPNDTLTREQILSVLWRAAGSKTVSEVQLPYGDSDTISDYAKNAVNWAYANGIIDNSDNSLSPQGNVTRADMALILYRYLSGQSDSSDNFISLTDNISELDKGFSGVRYEGEDFFEKFIAQGGAKSDADVIRFLQSEIGENANGLGLDVGGFACSALTADGTNGDKLFGRNFDWYNCNALVTLSKPINGYASIATVNTDFIKTVFRNGFDRLPDKVRALVSLYAPLDGMNEKGLCAAVLMIQDNDTINQNSEKPDITTTTAIRMLLNKAATTDEAIEMLRQYDFHASFGYVLHFAISDSSGKSAAVEYVNNEMIVTETPILTNFYVAEGEKYGIGTSQSHTRFEMLQNTLSKNSVMTETDMKNAMESVSKKHFHDGETTEWSIVYNKTNGTANYYHKENFDKEYKFKIN